MKQYSTFIRQTAMAIIRPTAMAITFLTLSVLVLSGESYALDPVGSYTFSTDIDMINDVAYENGMLYVGRRHTDNATSSISVLDVSDVSSIRELSPVQLITKQSSDPHDIKIYGDYLLIGNARYDAFIVDKSDPNNISIDSRIPFPKSGMAIAVLNTNYFFEGIGWGSSGSLLTIDWSNPLSPFIANEISGLDHPANYFDIYGNHLYTVWMYNSGIGFRIYDISSPLSPVEVGNLPGLGAHVYLVKADNNRAYIATLTNFLIVDVSDPSNPTVIDSYDFPSQDFWMDIEKVGNEVLVVGGGEGLFIFDVSGDSINLKDRIQPSNPGCSTQGIDVNETDELIYISDNCPGQAKVFIYDYNDGKVPVLLVHGFGGNPEDTWGDMDELLTQNGFNVFNADFSEAPIEWKIPEIAAIISIQIAQAMSQANASQIDIVAHSMGGLATRAYMAGLVGAGGRNYKGEVRRFIMIATPNHGSKLADFGFITQLVNEKWSPAQAAQMKFGSDFIWDLNVLVKHFYS